MKTIIISLCDYTGNWAKPYAEAGYDVVLVDPKREDGMDVQTFATQASRYRGQVQGILMAPPLHPLCRERCPILESQGC